MKKALAIVALVAAMFVAGKAQAQNMFYVGYAPETFVESNSSWNFQGFGLGFSKYVNLTKGLGVAAGAQLRMNIKSGDAIFGFGTGKSTQLLVDVPILLNYDISINRDLSIAPFVGPMLSLAVVGNTKTSIAGTSHTTNWYDDNSSLNRFNLYAVFGADIRFSSFNLFGGYRLGLIDLAKSDYSTLKANGFFVGLGFNF